VPVVTSGLIMSQMLTLEVPPFEKEGQGGFALLG